MVEASSAPHVEVGCVVFRSWEHQWQTDHREAPSVASASRTMPKNLTQPIYEVLEQWERDFLRSSLPFPPYGLRIRAVDGWMDFADGSYHLKELARRSLPISYLCPNWDEMIPQKKKSKYGSELIAPSGDTMVRDAYEVIWQDVVPRPVELDTLLRQFSPRYKEPSPFGGSFR